MKGVRARRCLRRRSYAKLAEIVPQGEDRRCDRSQIQPKLEELCFFQIGSIGIVLLLRATKPKALVLMSPTAYLRK